MIKILTKKIIDDLIYLIPDFFHIGNLQIIIQIICNLENKEVFS